MNRDDHSELVFRDSADPALFLRTLGEACGKTDWQVHSYCLMSNHFHLVVETPRANLVAGMKWFVGYAIIWDRPRNSHELRRYQPAASRPALLQSRRAAMTRSRPVSTKFHLKLR
jgi:REP element-mobilizing transposase RayT